MVEAPGDATAVLRRPAAPAARAAWMDVDWSAHRRRWLIDGRWVGGVELGSGPPLLFVHGLSGCWQNWLEQLPTFAATHRVIAVDLPGFGESEPPRGEISMAGYAAVLDRLCDALGITEPIAVVGNSMGGFVAAELALAAPERVARLVLVSAAGISSDRAPRARVMTAARALGLATRWAASRHEPFARRRRLRRLALSFIVRHPERLSAPLAFELMRGSGRPTFLPALEAVLATPLRARLPAIACPTLVVWGAHDRVIPVRDAHRFAALIPDARAVVLPDTGHLPMAEQPDRFNGLLARFLAQEQA